VNRFAQLQERAVALTTSVEVSSSARRPFGARRKCAQQWAAGRADCDRDRQGYAGYQVCSRAASFPRITSKNGARERPSTRAEGRLNG